MKCRDLVRSSKNASVILCAALILSAPVLDSGMSASASVSSVNISNLANLLSRMRVASANVRKLKALVKRQATAAKLEAKHNLQVSLQTQKKAEENFTVAINRGMVESSGSVKLLATYAMAFNARVVADESLNRADSNLNKDQELIRYLQKALNAVVTGGQSDMNSELGSMRLKLSQASNRVASDKADVTLATNEVRLAITNLRKATLGALADPLASIAINASADLHLSPTYLRRKPEDPLAWNWTLK